jgi:hypothetical protein
MFRVRVVREGIDRSCMFEILILVVVVVRVLGMVIPGVTGKVLLSEMTGNLLLRRAKQCGVLVVVWPWLIFRSKLATVRE